MHYIFKEGTFYECSFQYDLTETKVQTHSKLSAFQRY